MKKTFFTIISFMLLINLALAVESEKAGKNISVRDICEIFTSQSPIINYDMLFGYSINAYKLFEFDNSHNCVEFEYKFNSEQKLTEKKIFHIYTAVHEYRKYKYYSSGLLAEITHKGDDFIKSLEFFYDDKGRIVEIREYIECYKKDTVIADYDYLAYRFNKKGYIIEVRGVNNYMLGFKQKNEIIKIYDYDDQNRLKAIRNFKNPDDTRFLSYDGTIGYVK